MKHWMSLMLILLLVVGLCIPAGAAGDGTTYTDMSTATFDVNYTVPDGQDLTKRPTADFEFTVTADAQFAEISNEAYPTNLPTIEEVVFGSTEITNNTTEKKATITLPTYDNYGVYRYTITQNDPKISGVEYHASAIKLVVQVIRDETNGDVRVAAVHCETQTEQGKTDNITNTYKSGSLAITKEVTGNMGDQNQYFDVTVTLTAPADTTASGNSTVVITGGSEGNLTNSIEYGVPTDFKFKHNDTITLSNIAAGATYTVKEKDYTGTGDDKGYEEATYTYSNQGQSKAITSGVKDTVKITNQRGVNVDTGISLDNAPYLLLLAVVLVAGTVLVLKRRHREKD